MTKHPDLFAALAAPFEPHEVKVRSQANRQFHYITARTAQNRLDAVIGPENWWDEYFPNQNSVLCRLTIRLPDGTELTKCDAGGYAGMSDQGDDDKSGYSDAFKRTCVKFGVARYLYRDGVPEFVREREDGIDEHTPSDSEHIDNHRHSPPSQGRPDRTQQQHVNGSGSGSSGGHHGPPRTGKALFAWCKSKEEENGPGLIKYLNEWAKNQRFPGKMIEWTTEEVEAGHQEALSAIARVSGEPAESADAEY